MQFLQVILAGAQIASALAISKSSNKNEVHYAVDVDGACVPAGATPVHPYWQMREKSSDATEALSSSEERAFGVARQDVDHDSVHITLRGLPQRPISFRTYRASSGACVSEATTAIAGEPARLDGIYVKLKLFGLDYVELTGVSARGAPVRERMSM
jgi:hypothetical protein